MGILDSVASGGALAAFGHRAPGGVGCLRAGRGVRLLWRLVVGRLSGAGTICSLAGCLGSGFGKAPCLPMNRLAMWPRRAAPGPNQPTPPGARGFRVLWGWGPFKFRGQLPTTIQPPGPKKKLLQPPRSLIVVRETLSTSQQALRPASRSRNARRRYSSNRPNPSAGCGVARQADQGLGGGHALNRIHLLH